MNRHLSEDVEFVLRVTEYIQQRGRITNRDCRSEFKIQYDEAISLFKDLMVRDVIVRHGAGSQTYYTLLG